MKAAIIFAIVIHFWFFLLPNEIHVAVSYLLDVVIRISYVI